MKNLRELYIYDMVFNFLSFHWVLLTAQCNYFLL